MTDAGFFRGTSADQDNRFADKQKKLLKELNYSPMLNTKLNMSKIDLESLKPWIELKIKEILEKDDEILSDSIYEHLAGKEPDGKNLLVLLTGFVEEDSKASKFMEELWTKLLDTQQNSNGPSPKANATASPENGVSRDAQKTNEQTHTDPPRIDSSDNITENTAGDKKEIAAEVTERKSRSHSRTPQPKRSDSKSHLRSKSRSPHHSGSVSRSSSKSLSKSRSRSKSGSRSHSRSRSGSRRRSSSRSRSRSRSSSKSRHSRSRSRSPHYRSNRFRRSRSRSGSYRSPRGRRGYVPRGSYRGGFGYNDRRRGGPIGPPRGRRMISPPWSRRRSPPSYRRRRSPSPSPRRRSRSPLYRGMRSRSRSPAYGHAGRRSPRPHGFSVGPPMGPMGGRHVPSHDIHRPVITSRSPRGPPTDYTRGYGESSALPGHSPGQLMGRSHDLPATSHGISSGPPRASGSGAYSPRSPSTERKRHKKDKKHRKHKKSKKRHSSSSSPERRKKHKKHKKSKKHKS